MRWRWPGEGGGGTCSGCPGEEEPLCLFQCPVAQARQEVAPPVWGALTHLLTTAWRQDFSQEESYD